MFVSVVICVAELFQAVTSPGTQLALYTMLKNAVTCKAGSIKTKPASIVATMQ